ncbi:hypothetical protein OF83DRAFT_1117143, partial [Amylostereum chailletii]
QFRKEAIFRRMKHYSRENDRGQARIAELERLKGTYEASLAVMGACWTQIVESIRDLTKADDQAVVAASTTELLRIPKGLSTESGRDLEEIFQEKAKATCELVTALIQIHAEVPTRAETVVKYQQVFAQCTTLRARLTALQKELEDCKEERDKYHDDLAASEGRLDRLQSRTVQAAMGRKRSATPAPDAHPGARRDSEDVEMKMEDQPGGISSPSSPPPAGASGRSEELLRLQDRLAATEKLRREHEAECAALRQRLQTAELPRIPDLIQQEDLLKIPSYGALVNKATHFQLVSENQAIELAKLRAAYHDLQQKAADDRQEWEEAQKPQIAEWQSSVEKRDPEIVRMRLVRDQCVQECRVVRAQLELKEQGMEELQKLNASFSERLDALVSEKARLTRLLVAKAGDQELLQLISEVREQDVHRLQDRITVLETILGSYEEKHPEIAPHIRAEVDLRRQLNDATKQLNRYRSTYGESSSLPPDMDQLSKELARKDEELRSLKLQESEREHAEAPLYNELDKLSAAWEKLEKQVKSKVFDLVGIEEKIRRVVAEKAKTETKLATVTTARDAGLTDIKALKRVYDKQMGMISTLMQDKEGLDAALRNLRTQVVKLELSLGNAEEEARTWTAKSNENYKFAQDWQAKTRRAHAELAVKVQETQRAEKERHKTMVEIEVFRKENERLKAAAKARPTTTSQEVAELQLEVKSCMVRLASVEAFCKQCIDARISTRQRKCPACNLAFSQGDVQQMYLQ